MCPMTSAHKRKSMSWRRRFTTALCSALLLGGLALGVTAAPAQADLAPADPLLAGFAGLPALHCPNDSVNPNWIGDEQVRQAVYCLINNVRARYQGMGAPGSRLQWPKLSFCSLHNTVAMTTYCESSFYSQSSAPCYASLTQASCNGLSVPQLSGLNIAAQQKSQNVLNCYPSINPDPHQACGIASDYWVRSPRVCIDMQPWPCAPWNWSTPTGPPPVSEVLTAAWPTMTAWQAVNEWLHSSATVTGPGYHLCQPGATFCHREALLDPKAWAIGVGVSTGASNGLFVPNGLTGTVFSAYIGHI